MKTISYLFCAIISFIFSCKENGPPLTDDNITQSSFSYGNYVISKDAASDIEIEGNFAYLTFTKSGNEVGLPHLNFQIDDFKGIGTYNLDSGKITIYGTDEGDEFYWKNFYADGNNTVYAKGKIAVSRCDDRFVAVISGMLYHEEISNGSMVLKSTAFEARTNQEIL